MTQQGHSRLTVDADLLPKFTACYLRLAPDSCAFIESNTAHAVPKLLAALRQAGRAPEDVRYVVVTHAHLDHAAGAGKLLEACPRATLLTHPRAAKHLVDPTALIASATQVYGAERFAMMYGEVKPIAKDRVRALADGERFEFGGANLTAWYTSGHAYHHLVVDDPATESVYTGDTYGLVYPALQTHGPFIMASTSPTGFNAEEAKKSVAKVLSLNEKYVCPTHFDGHENSKALADQLLRFIEQAGAWVDEAARGDEPREVMQARLVEAWWRAVLREAPRFGEKERQHLALDLELNAQGLTHAALERRAKQLQAKA
jgi:glyoxylase-like metal-dependent hydrolase (beta-lactamase superfamily II)